MPGPSHRLAGHCVWRHRLVLGYPGRPEIHQPARSMSLFDSLNQSGIQIPKTDAERNELVVTEGSTGYWHYHLSRRVNVMRGLCGAPTLPTAIPLSAWGAPAEEGLPKPPKYCDACARLAWPASDTTDAATASSAGPAG